MAFEQSDQDVVVGTHAPARSEAQVAGFLRSVYGWMCLGLAITAGTALWVSNTPGLVQSIASNRLLFWGILIAQFGVVIYLSARVQRLAPATAGLLFTGYSALTGVFLSLLLLIYTAQSIASTFLVSASMFGALALYGTVTRRDLSGLGQFAMMGLFGVLIASVVGIFWQNSMFQFVLSVCGVVVFTGLTAWDAQRLRALALALPEGRTGSYAIVGALKLYLDFINLFLFLLNLFGRRR
ncbi:MAG TPA: Bax inhibitor-1/YccA family protein [Gemmatimonadales bacterium]|nr:Bax inhibitor-1/YccA family protein [Gemmatimonadales bacterium]